MPKREDERQLNLAGKHPVYCTCVDCANRFLRRKGFKLAGQAGFPWPRLKALGRGKPRSHPADCNCATCNLLRSVDGLPALDRGKGGFWKRLLGKR